MLTHRRIEANPYKCQAILEIKSSTSVKEIHWLMRRTASLSRFLAASTQKALPFFVLLRKNNFEWISEYEAAFQEFKSYLSSPLILRKHEFGRPLYSYLSVSDAAVAGSLVWENMKQQHLMYFVSKILQWSILRCQKLEKFALALIFTTPHLWQYFQAHTIVVRIDQPIR